MDIILRAEAVETAQSGDRCDYTETLMVVPDVGSLNLPGAAPMLGLAKGTRESRRRE